MGLTSYKACQACKASVVVEGLDSRGKKMLAVKMLFGC